MLTPPVAVVVTLDGTILESSVEATLVGGTVVAPVVPFVDALAERSIERGRTVVIEGRGRRITLALGERVMDVSDGSGRRRVFLAMAPYRSDGAVVVPLAAVARALGFAVRLERPDGEILAIERGPAPAIETAGSATLPPGPYETFAPRIVATPARPLPSYVPQPRRTPVHVDAGGFAP